MRDWTHQQLSYKPGRRLCNDKDLFIDKRSTPVTHTHIPTISPFLAFQYGTLDVGNYGLGAHNCGVGIYCELGLETDS